MTIGRIRPIFLLMCSVERFTHIGGRITRDNVIVIHVLPFGTVRLCHQMLNMTTVLYNPASGISTKPALLLYQRIENDTPQIALHQAVTEIGVVVELKSPLQQFLRFMLLLYVSH